jgi:hypothetical protein
VKRRWLVIAGVFVVLAAVVAMNVKRNHTIGRAGSTELAAGQPLAISDEPAGYDVVYRVERKVGSDVTVSTDHLSVLRPFSSRVESRRGPPPGHDRTSLAIGALGRNENSSPSGAPLTIELPPAVAPADVRLSTVVQDALDQGVLQRRERRRVAGRVCQVFRSGGLFASGALTPATATAAADTCVDANGIVLEEVLRGGGVTQLRRVAVAVREQHPPAADFAVTGSPLAVADGGGSTRAVDPTSSPPGPFWQLDAPPDGFTLAGRFAVVPPQPENYSDPLSSGAKVASITDVFIRGADAVFVDRGSTLQGSEPFTFDPAHRTVDLGPLGRGEIILSARGAEVRALTGVGGFVRVYGTLPVAQLADVARRLRQVDGTTLRYL